jgi:hypothetical protein
MIIDKTRRCSINNLWTTLFSFDTASKKTSIVLSFSQELPETFFTSIMLNHLVREATCLFVSNKNLLWLKSCEFLNTFIDISRDQVSIAPVQFSICFLDKRNPHFVSIFGLTEHLGSFHLVDWNSVINDDIDPVEVLEHSENVESSCSELVENGWIDTIAHQHGNLFVNNHVWIVLHSSSSSHQKLISSRAHSHGRNQPAITKSSLKAIS